MLTGKAVAKRVDDRPVILLSNPEQRCNRQCHALCVKERRQIDVAHAVRKRGQHPFSEFDREARLAAAADTGQGEQPRLAEQNGVFVEIIFVADETRQLTAAGCVALPRAVMTIRWQARFPA